VPEVVIQAPSLNRVERFRRTLGAAITDGFFVGVTNATKRLPIAHPDFHGVEVERDVPYLTSGNPSASSGQAGGPLRGSTYHLADIWRPRDRKGPLPVCLYIHGGRFARLSKDTHWLFNLVFARRGYLVVSINYRLAPAHRFPAAVEDVCAAWTWLLENVERLGGDPDRIIVAGESAGGNLTTALALATCYRRPEPFARAVFDLGAVPKAVMPACAVLQVSKPEHRGLRSAYFQDRFTEMTEDYLHGVSVDAEHGLDLADPVVMLERGVAPDRPLPPFFAPVGTWDLLIDDTRRLAAAVTKLGGRCEARYYPYGLHAFHGFVFTPQARQCWREAFAFLNETLR
jgi:acetyl esterase